MAQAEVLHKDDTLVVVRDGDLLTSIWWDAPRLEQMVRLSELGREAEVRLGRPMAYAQFIVGGTPRFSNEVREEAAKMTANELFGVGTAHIIEIGGLKGAATRAFLNTIMLLGRTPTPVKVFGAPEHGAEWIAEQLASSPETWDAHRVLAARQAALAARDEGRAGA